MLGRHFTEPGGYAALQAALGFSKDQALPRFQRKFQGGYYLASGQLLPPWRRRAEALRGDALVRWLSFHTGMEFLTMEAETPPDPLSAEWKELCVFTDTPAIAVSLAPHGGGESPAPACWPPSGGRGLRCAFYSRRTPDQRVDPPPTTRAGNASGGLGSSVSVSCYYDVDPQGAEAVVEEAVAGRAELIFTTSVSPDRRHPAVAVKYPKCLPQLLHRPAYVKRQAYYCRVYEPSSSTGAIAGALCKNGTSATWAVTLLSVPASINAFALGASLTNRTPGSTCAGTACPGTTGAVPAAGPSAGQ